MRKITAELLTEKDACPDQIDRFRERFPDGVDPLAITPEEAARFDVGWAVHVLLPPAAWKAFEKAVAPARKTHDEVMAPAWETYREAVAPAWKEFREAQKALNKEARAAAREAYEEAVATARKALSEVRNPAWKARGEAEARAAIELFREYWR